MENEKIDKETTDIVKKEKQFIITNQETADRAGNFLKEITTLEKRIIDHYKPMKQAADAAKKKILDAEKESLKPVSIVKAAIKEKLTAYDIAEEKKRRELQEKLRREAEQAAIEAARKAAIEKAEQEALTAAIESGSDEIPEPVVEKIDIERIRDQVIVPILPETNNNFTKVITWSVEITDFGSLPDEYKLPDMVKLGQIARAMKNGFNIPGAKAIPTESVRAAR